jgi:hypothetical protein
MCLKVEDEHFFRPKWSFVRSIPSCGTPRRRRRRARRRCSSPAAASNPFSRLVELFRAAQKKERLLKGFLYDIY